MTRVRMVWKSLAQHALSTSVTVVSVALAGGLLMAVWVTREQARRAFTTMTGGFDAVLGARGSKLQLVLNGIFHLEASPGNLPWADYLEIRRHPAVERAVPIAVGDNYRGFRIAGTTPDYFQTTPAPRQSALSTGLTMAPGGRWFDPELREAVVGSFAARQLGLKPGDTFHPFHGLIFDEAQRHSETYLVVGVLRPSNSPADRVLWIPIAGVQNMSGHDPGAASDVSAVLVKLKSGNPVAGFQMDMLYNRQGNRLTFAWPIGQIVGELFDKIAWFDRVLALVAGLVALVSAAFILASLYNSMNERRRDLAILRALGARRWTIFTITLLEAVAMSTLGIILGFAVQTAILAVVAHVLRIQTGVVLNVFTFHPVMAWGPAALIGLGAVAGILPAVKAYRTDVAAHLAPVA